MKKAKSHKERRYFVSIDPSINDIGLAIWEQSSFRQLAEPLAIHEIQTQKYDYWTDKLKDLNVTLNSVLAGHGVGMRGAGCLRAYVEQPGFFASAKGRASADRGDLVKLSASFGAIAGFCWYGNIQFIPVTVQEWKGNLTKDTVKRRILKLLPNIDPAYSSHCFDAVGIGLYAKGLF